MSTQKDKRFNVKHMFVEPSNFSIRARHSGYLKLKAKSSSQRFQLLKYLYMYILVCHHFESGKKG